MLRVLRRLNPKFASDISVVSKSTNVCVMNVSISGCVEQSYGYRAPHHHGITFEGARRDIA